MGVGTRVRGECLSAGLLADLQAAYPDVKARGWRRAVIDALAGGPDVEGFRDDFVDEVRRLAFVPDAYAVSAADRWLHFFEIEVYNPMSTAKLRAYGKFTVDLDSFGVAFAVLVINRHGHINRVDLLPHYAAWLDANAGMSDR